MSIVRRFPILLGGAVVAVALAAILLPRGAAASPYDELFPRVRVGMAPAEVEAILGPPTGPPGDADTRRLLVGRTFDDVDAPPLGVAVVSAYWYDGRDRRIRVEYVDRKVWRAKLNGPGLKKGTGTFYK